MTCVKFYNWVRQSDTLQSCQAWIAMIALGLTFRLGPEVASLLLQVKPITRWSEHYIIILWSTSMLSFTVD